MPKKLCTNQKALDARVRKEAVKKAEKERVENAKQDAIWKDDDKQLAKKQARKDEKDRKEAEERERKKEREKLLSEEMSQLRGKEAKEPKPQKVTRAQIENRILTTTPTKIDNKSANLVASQDDPITENVNRIKSEGEVARNLDEAIEVLKVLKTSEIDRHPERRAKAARDAFEAVRLPQLKAENPSLRLSQLRQMIRKEWTKHPDNHLNQRLAAYNTKLEKKQSDDESSD